MSTVPAPWGVTPALVASRVQSMQLTADSSPSLSDVEAIIAEHAAWVAARLRRVGVGPDLVDGSETMLIARGCVFRLVVCEVDTLRGREATTMTDLQRDAEARIAAIDVGPQGLGDGAEGSRAHRLATSASLTERIERFNSSSAPLGSRLAGRGKL